MNKTARCIDCAHQSHIDWSRGITQLSGYCPAGNRYIGKHVNKHGVNQSLHAQRKCSGFKPKEKLGVGRSTLKRQVATGLAEQASITIKAESGLKGSGGTPGSEKTEERDLSRPDPTPNLRGDVHE